VTEQLGVTLDSARAARSVTWQVRRLARVRAATALTAPASRLLGDGVRLAGRLLPPGVTLSIEGIDALLDECELDMTELLQVLSNLLKDASDAMAGQGHVSIQARAAAGSLIVSVTDNGPGMPPETASRTSSPSSPPRRPGAAPGSACPLIEDRHRLGRVDLRRHRAGPGRPVHPHDAAYACTDLRKERPRHGFDPPHRRHAGGAPRSQPCCAAPATR
jgi:hypothetical protein